MDTFNCPTFNCPKCGRVVSVYWATCPYCYDSSEEYNKAKNDAINAAGLDAKELRKNSGGNGWLIFVGVTFAIAIVLFVWVFILDSQPKSFGPSDYTKASYATNKDSYGNDSFTAFVAAKQEVEELLKSPSTAEFCDIDDASITRSGDRWTIAGYVDAQNGFGATLRKKFFVEVTFTGYEKYRQNLCYIED